MFIARYTLPNRRPKASKFINHKQKTNSQKMKEILYARHPQVRKMLIAKTNTQNSQNYGLSFRAHALIDKSVQN